MTEAQKIRTEKHWGKLAGEKVEVKRISSAIYAFGSELACLRLFFAFRNTDSTNTGYSKNLEKYYFVIEE